TGPQGPPISFKGAWLSTAAYAIGDSVSENGGSYIALAANQAVDPAADVAGKGTNWAVLAAQGDVGSQGVAGPAGAMGPQGPVGGAGATGPAGLQGATGPTGATGPLGQTGPPVRFKGAWLSTAAYTIGDSVSENGGSYIALAANQAVDPAADVAGEGTNWAVLAAQGAAGLQGWNGATGTQGLSGATGPQGPVGSTGATGATGPGGPQGATGLTGSTGPQGPPISFKGAWLSTAAYAIGDSVSENGGSYIALAANQAVDAAADATGTGMNWANLSAQGATGAQGLMGPQGPIGVTGAMGPKGPAGPAGGAANIALATAGQPVVYTGSTTVGGVASLPMNAGGTGATSAADALANLSSAAGGVGPCPGIVNDGKTDNTAALNACIATGQAYILPTNCQGSQGLIIVAGQLNSGTLGNNVGGTALYGGGYGPYAKCSTTIAFTGTTSANSGFAFSCSNNNGITATNYCDPAAKLQNMNIVSLNGSTGAGVAMEGTNGAYNGDELEMNDVLISGFAQCIAAQGYGNGYLGKIECRGTGASAGLFLIDIAGGSSNSWVIDKLEGECIKTGVTQAAGMLRIQWGIGNKVYFGDVNNCANVATLGYYNSASSSWNGSSMSEIWLGDTENITGPLVVVGYQSQAAVHWLGLEGTYNNTSSSPFVMNGFGALTLYNPPGTYVASTPHPLVTKGVGDMVSVIGGSFITGNYGNLLSAIVQDSGGNQYFAGTPLTEVPSGSLPPASLYTRFRCFGVASSSGADSIQCGYQSAPGVYAYTPNLANVLTSSTSSNRAVSASSLVDGVSDPGSASLALSGSCAGCGASGAGLSVKDANGNEIGTLVG
ncbi:MAG: hypothetical protein ABR991_12315, partial [Terracidiphilus sp.]